MLSKDQDIEVYTYYLGEVVPGRMYRSILPTRKDDNPSFGLFQSAYIDRIMWKDFASDYGGNYALDLICAMEGCSKEAALDFYFRTIRGRQVAAKVREIEKTYPTVSYRKEWYLAYELEYWKKRYTFKDELLHEKIYGVDGMYASGKQFYWTCDSDFAFFYDFDEGWKVYRPLADKRNKWKSKNLTNVIEGIQTIPRIHSSLIIASSTKDRLAWKKFHPAVINPTGEAAFSKIMARLHELKLRFPRIVSIFDADDAGVRASLALQERSEGVVEHIDARQFTPGFLKDADDLIVRYGLDKINKVLNDLKLI